MASAEYVVESYADYLRGLGRKFWKRFQTARLNAPESAVAEAMVFRVLLACKVDPMFVDAPGVGGPDFSCLRGKPQEFMVEATSLLPERVTEKSNIPNRAPEDLEGGSFGLLTAQIDETATKKLHQFRSIAVPGVLAIASSHFASTILLDALAAMHALVSQPSWVIGNDRMSTDLKYSLFLRTEDGKVVIKNSDISAVLLVAIGTDRSYVCGALHPEPSRRFDSAALCEIPFVYLKDWPAEQNKLRTMWTLGTAPKPLKIPHAAIR